MPILSNDKTSIYQVYEGSDYSDTQMINKQQAQVVL
jgi:hypothetical protein